MAKRKGVTFDISIGELSERTVFSDEFYDRLLAFIAAHPHSLGRVFEVGATALMAAFSGDPFATEFMETANPKPSPKARQAKSRGRKGVRRGKARK